MLGGFIVVILGRSELFTEHTTLAAFPVLDGRASVGQLGPIDPVHLADLAASLLDHSGSWAPRGA